MAETLKVDTHPANRMACLLILIATNLVLTLALLVWAAHAGTIRTWAIPIQILNSLLNVAVVVFFPAKRNKNVAAVLPLR